MDFHYELLEETRKEIKNIRFFREDVEINAEEYEVIHDYDEAYENAFFESLFKAYILGGWPCGWKNGKIIAYIPANNAHVL